MMPQSDAGSVWITGDVAIPQDLLDAHEAQNLVIFVGAGASVDSPSDLPLFDKLARDLADMARVPFDADVALDFFLGSMPEEFALHSHARDLIAKRESAPNTTHRAIVRLADARGPVRIVTTNFDDHLMAAAKAEGIGIDDQWIGPALPLGHDFAGIVHLHGSVLRDPMELILTDTDFGRAYVTYAWAARFLLSMFREFTVLFVGYSHDDPIMRYLALGLPSATPRYVLIDSSKAADPKWARLSVATIGYPVHGHDHSALVAALQSWDALARMGQFEHQARMKAIVEAGPRLTPVDRDYVNARVKTSEGAQEFTEANRTVDKRLRLDWLHWAEDLPEFKALFSGIGDLTDASLVLGDWFCRDFIADAELSGAALQTVQRLGQRFGPRLFEMARWSIGGLATTDSDAALRWRVLLATSIHGHSAPVEASGILSYEPGAHAEHAAVLNAVLRPYLKLKQRWFIEEEERPTAIPDAEVTWNSEEAPLTAHVQKAVDTAHPGDPRLKSLLERSVNAAYDLLEAYHGERSWDPVSFGRSAIEPHAQDEYRDPVDALIDGLRAYGEKALPSHPDVIEDWWSLGRGLFRRVALHLLALDGTRNPDEKLVWLLDRSILFDIDLKHEAFRVLQIATPHASEEPKRRLLEDAVGGPDLPADIEDRERHTAYSTYNLLVWLTASDPAWTEAGVALEELQDAHPQFAPRENPDFDRWVSSGTWGGQLPMEPEDFSRAWDIDPEQAVNDLLGRDYSERAFMEPDWDDCLSLIKQVVEARPDIGGGVWDLLIGLDVDAERAADIRRAIVGGWSSADLDEFAPTALRHVESLLDVPESGEPIARFLRQQIGRLIETEESPALELMRELAVRLWRERRADFVTDDDADPLTFAPLYLNSWPGDLAQYWMSEIDRRWRKNRATWTGLNQQERTELKGLLTDSRAALPATGPALAGQLFFIFAADPDFAVENLFPLFGDQHTAVLAWHPYLHHPRVDNKLLASGFTEILIAEWERLDALGQDDLRRQFFGLVASIVSFADITAEQRTALVEASVLVDDGRHAPEFASAVMFLLSEESVEGGEIYTKWLGEHLSARVQGIPRTAREEELSRWVDVVPYLGEQIPSALEVLGDSGGVGLGTHYIPPDIPSQTIRDFGPTLVEHYAERVRNTARNDYFTGHRVRKIVNCLRSELDEAALRPLIDAANEKGLLTDDFD